MRKAGGLREVCCTASLLRQVVPALDVPLVSNHAVLRAFGLRVRIAFGALRNAVRELPRAEGGRCRLRSPLPVRSTPVPRCAAPSFSAA